MNEIFDSIAARQGGVVMRAQALTAGYSAAEIDRRRQRQWVSIRRGAYADRAGWEAMSPVQRHIALAHAVVQSLEVPAVVSHQSAVVMRDLPAWDLDLSVVHVTRGDLHSPRLEAGVHHHAGKLLDEDLDMVGGVMLTAPARTAIDVARETPFEPSVVVADAMLHRGLVDKATMLDRLDRMRDWPGTCNAGRVVEFADGLSESVGESRTRVLFDAVGFPRPVLQKTITLASGELTRSDFYFEEDNTLGEFDGRTKYGRLLKPGEDPGDVVWREKKREDRLRDLGYEVCRLIWAELRNRSLVAERFRAAFTRAGRRRAILI